MMKEYISPITLIQKEINYKIEDDIYEAVLGCDIEVDREELIKALNYDRNQYNRGFQDGVNSVLNKIANFKDEINMCVEKLLGEEELIEYLDKRDDEENKLPIGFWYEDTDKRKPSEEMIYQKPNGEEYIWKDDMWVRTK